MKKLLGIVVLCLLWCNTSFTESTLPPCQGEDHTQYVNCYGSYVGKDYSEIYNQPGLTADYTGEFGNSPGLSHGKGISKSYVNGEYTNGYVGEFKDDKFNGQGTFTGADGFKYVGEWENDKFHGQGTLTWADGNKYVGEFKSWSMDSYPHGQGTFTYADGGKYVGELRRGEFHGLGKYKCSSSNRDLGILDCKPGRIIKGIWEDNRLVNVMKLNF